jgi:hypothetical protein
MGEDPSSPGDLAAFLALVTILVILVALAIYVMLMTLIWWGRRKQGVKWRTFVIPGLKPPREYAWEVGLSALTAITLAATMTLKAAVVDDALSADAPGLGGAPAAGTVADVGREFLSLGQEGAARQVLAQGLERVFNSHPSLRLPLSKWLVAACLVLLGLYLVRLLQLRLESARRSTSEASGSAPDLKRLALVGVCFGLLLASPLGALDGEELLDTGMGLMRRHEGLAPGPVEAACRCLPDSAVVARIASLERAVRNRDRAAAPAAGVPQPVPDDSALRAAQERLDAVNRELSALRDSVRALASRSVLLVLADPGRPYLLDPSPVKIARPRGARAAGLHDLAEGNHRIVVRMLGVDTTVTLAAGGVATVDLRGRSPPIQ